MHGLARFLGDSPLRVAVRLIVLSIVVGLVLSIIGIHPFDIYFWIEQLALRIYDMGFAFIGNAFQYFLIGALIVVPLFLLGRLFRLGTRRPNRLD